MIVHLGVACYDKLKNVILPVQVYFSYTLGLPEREQWGYLFENGGR